MNLNTAKLIFLEPKQAIPTLAKEFIFSEFSDGISGVAAVDFSDTLFIVPTRQAVKTLKEGLISKFSQAGADALLSLNVATSEDLIAKLYQDSNLPNAFEKYSSWRKALADLGGESLAEIFPENVPDKIDFLNFFRTLENLKSTLSENFLEISSLAKRREFEGEASRWRALSRLEGLYKSHLAKLGKCDVLESLQNKLAEAPKFLNYKKIYILFTPTLTDIFINILKRVAGVDIYCVIASSPSSSSDFDEWGRPSSVWLDRVNLVSQKDVYAFSSLEEQSEFVSQELAPYTNVAFKVFGIACDEKNSMGHIKDALQSRNINSYNPEGMRLSEAYVFAFLAELKEYLLNKSFKNLIKLLRFPILLKKLSSRSGLTQISVINLLDEFAAEHLPQNISAAFEIASAGKCEGVQKIFLYLKNLFDTLCNAPNIMLPEAFADFFEELFSENIEADKMAQESLECLKEALLKLASLPQDYLNILDKEDVLDIVLSDFDRKIYDAKKSSNAIALQNWIEIYWSQAPRLIVCDVNSGILPEAFPPDGFLTPSLRKALGLVSSEIRYARDAFMLKSLADSRSAAGFSAKFCCPRKNLNGDVLSPSKLLLAVDKQELPEVIDKFFKLTSIEALNPSFFAPWRLKIRKCELPKSLSPTCFKAYINCPFRFYLQYVLKMRDFDASLMQMNDMSFGSLYHLVWEDYAKNPENAALSDEIKIEKILFYNLEKAVKKTFGTELSAQVKFQIHSLKERLCASAKEQSQHALAGWRIIHAEKKISFNLEYLDANSQKQECKISGRIDRIDEHSNGSILALDYKTIDKLKLSKNSSPAMSEHLSQKKGEIIWKDLQLPLYKRALEDMGYAKEKIFTGYFLAPKNIGQTKIDVWEIDEDVYSKALELAKKISASIYNYEFLPRTSDDADSTHPDLNVKADYFKELFSFSPRNISKFLDFE